jgi:phage-related protein
MPDTFTIVPDRGFTRESKPRVNSASFGDGYSQRFAVGINTQDDTWSLTFRNRTIEDINAIITFLEDKKGATYFLWTPVGETTQVKVICSEWSVDYNSEFSKSLSCKFTRVYDI